MAPKLATPEYRPDFETSLWLCSSYQIDLVERYQSATKSRACRPLPPVPSRSYLIRCQRSPKPERLNQGSQDAAPR
ncbi:hypothetical protein T484DRAFT_3047763 [Baffinella frigidus]|nr:hypothetical protein T484DRAFT_3047763 [Cryptophyta sp. CCMP2293]